VAKANLIKQKLEGTPEEVDGNTPDPKVNPIFLIGSVHNNAEALVDWIQPGMLREGTVSMLLGMPSAGKSVFALKLANAIANGLSFLGHQHSPRPVLYLDRDDNSSGDVIDRCLWLKIDDHDGGNLKYFGSNMYLYEVPSPGDPWIEEWVKAQSVAPVIVMDSFTHFMPDGGDENSAKDVNEVWKKIKSLRRRGVSFIVLHHAGKGTNATTYRGSSAIRAGCDFMFSVTDKSDRSKGDFLTKVLIKRFKTRNGQQFGNKKSEMTIDITVEGYISSADQPTWVNPILHTLLVKNPDISRGDFIKIGMQADETRNTITGFLDEGVANLQISLRKAGMAKHYTWASKGSPVPTSTDDQPAGVPTPEQQMANIDNLTQGMRAYVDDDPRRQPEPVDDEYFDPREFTQADVDDRFWEEHELEEMGESL
jgi:hypothetical protein